MRYMNLKGHTHKVFDVGGYRHNYEGFYFKKIYIANVNYRGENNHSSWCSCKLCENSITSSLYLLVKSFEKEIQPSRDHTDPTRGSKLK